MLVLEVILLVLYVFAGNVSSVSEVGIVNNVVL